MSEKPVRAVKLNVINEPKDSYTGGKSTLCPGCGHDQISSVIINAAWENGIDPTKIAKMSGIGCSSKTPAYYLGQSHGFNTVHGRMPSVTTGAYTINKDLLYLGDNGFVKFARNLILKLFVKLNDKFIFLGIGEFEKAKENFKQICNYLLW